ncbi:MAG: hypothetical protein V4697_01675 [Patescibacteria group bacterium]
MKAGEDNSEPEMEDGTSRSEIISSWIVALSILVCGAIVAGAVIWHKSTSNSPVTQQATK